MKLPLRTWLAGSHLTVVALPFAAVLATGALATDLRAQTQADIDHQGVIAAGFSAALVENAREEAPGARLVDVAIPLSRALVAFKEETLAGFQVVDPRGIVVASSGGALGEDLGREPEVAAALDGRTGVTIRPRPDGAPNGPLRSDSRRADVRVFVGKPIRLDGELLGAIVVSRTPREELQAIAQLAPVQLGITVSIALVGALGVAAAAGWLATRSLKEMSMRSRAIAQGRPSDLARVEASHVAEVAEVAGAVARMAQQLEARLSYISEFAGNVSHEFKTPLSTLRGTLELLADDPAMPADQRARFLANAELEIARLDRLVHGLLALARADESPRDAAPVALGDVIAEVAGRNPGLAVVGQAGRVVGNAEQLAIALQNLVENAARHGRPPFAIEAFHADGRTGFAVVDAGAGISAGNLPKIFERFFTTDRVEGTGLGLALVAAVAHAHGGRPTVESAPGRTRIGVDLPAAP